MDQFLKELLGHLRGMWNRRLIGLAVAWAVAIIGFALAFAIPEKYEASARVQVDTQTLLKPVLEGLSIQPNLDQQVALISRTLLNRGNVEKLVQMNNLDAAHRFQRDARGNHRPPDQNDSDHGQCQQQSLCNHLSRFESRSRHRISSRPC